MSENQSIQERLQNFEPGKNIKNALNQLQGNSTSENMGQSGSIGSRLNIPENPGPALAGRTPLVGTLRRSNDLPVVRDSLRNQSS